MSNEAPRRCELLPTTDKQVVCGSLPQDHVKGIPLCLVAYKYLFHSCRIPQFQQDSYRLYDPSRYIHAVVACRNQFFCIQLFDSDNNISPIPVLEQELRDWMEQAHTGAEGVGLLTTISRNDWANARQEVLRLGGTAHERGS